MAGSDIITAVVRGVAPYAILAGAGYVGYRVLKKRGIFDDLGSITDTVFNAPQKIVKTITTAVSDAVPALGGTKPQYVEMTNPNPILNDLERGAQELKDWGDALQAVIPGDWNVKSDPLPAGKMSWTDFAHSLNKAPWQVLDEYKAYLAQ